MSTGSFAPPVRPPEALDAAGLVLRRPRVDDAQAIAEAVGVSLVALRLWMPWATEDAAEPEVQRQRLEQVAHHWEDGSDFVYVIVAEDRVVGSMGLHARVGVGALEIGYWVRTDYTGRGIATTGAGVLTSLALTLASVIRVEIRCDEANQRSAAIPERLRYRLDRVEPHTIDAPGQTGRSQVWVYPPGSAGLEGAKRPTPAG